MFYCHRVNQDKIVDEQKYIDYTFYMLDLFIQDIVTGYVD